MGVIAVARTMVAGAATGEALVLDEPLSLWGGLDPETGRIIDRRHPQAGAIVADRILVLTTGRGSSSSSSVLAEAVRLATAPAAIVLREPDPILVVGSLVAHELYGRTTPIVVIDREAFATVRSGDLIELEAGGLELRLGARRPSADS